MLFIHLVNRVVLNGEKNEPLIVFHEEGFVEISSSKNRAFLHWGREIPRMAIQKIYYNVVLD